MNTADKESIMNRTLQLIERQGLSANRYAQIAGVSASTITALKQRDWVKFSPRMWQKLAIACNYSMTTWRSAETTNLTLVRKFAGNAQNNSISIAISWHAGAGKSHAYKEFQANNQDVILLECADHWTRRIFMDKFLQALGIEGEGLKVVEKAELVIEELRKRERPLVILDECDKLKEGPFMFFIELYNKLDGYCGFLLSGAPYLRLHVEKQYLRDKKGYREIYSRIGRKFIGLNPITIHDVTRICQANGVVESEHIQSIFNDCEGDLRRVKRSIEILHTKLSKAA